MAYGNQGDFQRKMYQGNWQCSQCDNQITELPFEPDESRLDQLLCSSCHKAKRGSFSGGGDRGGRSFGTSQMYQGDWQCSQCNSKISELPFEPDPSRVGQLLCRDCHRQKRQSFGGGRDGGRGGRGGFRR